MLAMVSYTTRNMKYLLALLLLIADVAHAAGAPHPKDAAAYAACSEATATSRAAKRLEDLAGRDAVIELVTKKCGYRPIVKRGDGGLELSDEDCKYLFDWHKDGLCKVEDTVALDLQTREMDPRVFNRERFLDYCTRHRTAGALNNYEAFKKKVCVVPAAGK
jgi:hypothetical protein